MRLACRLTAAIALLMLVPSAAPCQVPGVPTGAAPPAASSAEPARDTLGRDTPRGTVRGFLSAARGGDDRLAVQYLNVKLPREKAEDLARQLFLVLDTGLSTRLGHISDAREGSGANPLEPNREVVGTIASEDGSVDIVLQRVEEHRGAPPVWLFSLETLESVPALYDEISPVSAGTSLPGFLTRTRVAGVRLIEWLAVLIGLPSLYVVTVLLNRLLLWLLAGTWRRLAASHRGPREIVPMPVRLLFLAIAVHWLSARVRLPLLARQFWLNLAGVLAIASIVWLLVLLNGTIEQYIRQRFRPTTVAAAASLLRLARRVADVLVLFAGLLATLRYLGVDATPALAGLGVGGIAVALAAQKTLENVIAGMSLVFDRAVSEGDFLKAGDTVGTVDHVGLRSTRIRTLDRTMVSVPNSQIANMSVETFSARDQFWFHHVVGLRYETTADQLQSVTEGIRRLLLDTASVDRESVRVRFIRLGAFSLDVDVFAYLAARDWNHFLEIQEQLLFSVMDVVQRAGAAVAFPSQTIYISGGAEAQSAVAGGRLTRTIS
jgi:MscS family membrane protein